MGRAKGSGINFDVLLTEASVVAGDCIEIFSRTDLSPYLDVGEEEYRLFIQMVERDRKRY